jgi:hypothetical protein
MPSHDVETPRIPPLETPAKRSADRADPTKWVAPSGATSSALKPEYRLVPFATIKRIGQRLTDGARKHGEGNWEKALNDRVFMMDRANHLIEHAYRAIEKLQKGIFTDEDDDDLGGIGANLAFLIGYQEHQRAKSSVVKLEVTTADKWACRPTCLNCGHKHYDSLLPSEFGKDATGECREACGCKNPQYTSPD